DLVYQLQQKHRVASIQELLQIKHTLEAKVQQFQNMDTAIDEAKKAMELAGQKMQQAGQALSKKRQEAFAPFSKSVTDIIRELGMPQGSFEISWHQAAPAECGLDEVNFLFSANKG